MRVTNQAAVAIEIPPPRLTGEVLEEGKERAEPSLVLVLRGGGARDKRRQAPFGRASSSKSDRIARRQRSITRDLLRLPLKNLPVGDESLP
jgi:hypothetical protein